MAEKEDFYPPPPSYDDAVGSSYQTGPFPQPHAHPQPPAYLQPQAYPQPQPAQHIIITATSARNFVTPVLLSKNPTHVTCSNCRHQVLTSVTSESIEPEYCITPNHSTCFILFVAGFFTAGLTWFCSCLPYAFCSAGPTTNIYRHKCTRCGATLGTYVKQN